MQCKSIILSTRDKSPFKMGFASINLLQRPAYSRTDGEPQQTYFVLTNRLWEEYIAAEPNNHGKDRFYELNRAWESLLPVTVRQSTPREVADD
ncbi:hypothetical protein CQ12_34365 [Bradyrhizobium jicamae]|uniref:Uncharacterized protein n=1 Tax=Bradyrhizobium jicamae TaxID=280332 RepID=A0A0R3LEV5_9BRAD|nr:hypothetical protein CQ12_34365 [Bradyrhizobium jicamae]